MRPLLLQQYLRSGGDPEALKERGVKMRRHGERGSLVLFKYDIGADFGDPLVRECRGVVLDESEGWRVVGRAFDKFFNLGEGHAAEIDWSTARVQEKLDGSLCTIYCHHGSWLVATTGTPDASGDTHGSGVTFSSYFWKTFHACGGKLPEVSSHGHMCFSFELMGPLNRIVVVHSEPWMRLLSARDRETGQCFWPEEYADLIGIPAVRSFPLTNVEEILSSFEHISPVSQEGYVVVDAAFNRIKIKHPGYVALHHAKDGMGPKAFVQIARSGEQSEVLAAFPEFEPLINDARLRYVTLVSRVRDEYERLKHLPTQKEFALEAVKTPYSAPLFQMRKGVELEAFFRDVAIEKLMSWMGVEDAAPAAEHAA